MIMNTLNDHERARAYRDFTVSIPNREIRGLASLRIANLEKHSISLAPRLSTLSLNRVSGEAGRVRIRRG